MADLIDRAKAIKAIEDMQDCYNGFSSTFDKAQIIGVLEEVPTAELPDICVGDIISRQAAIDALGEKPLAWTEGEYELSLQTQWQSDVDALKALPSAQPGWIPWNSGRFPEESGTYTVTAYDGATKRVTYAKYQKRLKRWELTGARAYWRVLAWMPLPEPYKGEKK